jgi:hypothetical protein
MDDYDGVSEHGLALADVRHLSPCFLLSPPFLNNCGIDIEKTFLSMFYGTLKSRTASPEGSYIQFNQNTFCASANCAAIGMDSTAWLYVPKDCAAQQAF